MGCNFAIHNENTVPKNNKNIFYCVINFLKMTVKASKAENQPKFGNFSSTKNIINHSYLKCCVVSNLTQLFDMSGMKMTHFGVFLLISNHYLSTVLEWMLCWWYNGVLAFQTSFVLMLVWSYNSLADWELCWFS